MCVQLQEINFPNSLGNYLFPRSYLFTSK